MLEYEIRAHLESGGSASVLANKSEISFDATAGRDVILPNPAELLLSSLAACLAKNLERYSEILKIPYRSAVITVKGKRTDSPPQMSEIKYDIVIDTDANDRKLNTWHKNIIKFGTITNTLKQVCNLTGEMKREG